MNIIVHMVDLVIFTWFTQSEKKIWSPYVLVYSNLTVWIFVLHSIATCKHTNLTLDQRTTYGCVHQHITTTFILVLSTNNLTFRQESW
jgi:hypothetical protein